MRLRSNPEIDALVAAARQPRQAKSPVPADAAEYGLWAAEKHGDPLAAQTWFRDLVGETQRDIVSNSSQHHRLLRRADQWSRWVLGPGRALDDYDDLARRWATAQRVNELANAHPERRAAALIKDEGGLALLRDRSTGAMIAYLHSGFVLAVGATLVAELDDRLVFVHADGATRDKRSAIEASGEALGWRFVGPRRRLEVLMRLLQEGEIVALPADVPGVAHGTLLGQPVRTTRAPAALARAASVPLVLMAGFWNDAGYEMRISAPIDPGDFDSVSAMHAAVMQQADTWLSDHPEQLQVRFPAADLSRLLARHRVLKARVDGLQRAVAKARSAVDEAVLGLKADESAERRLARANQDLAELMRELRDAKTRQIGA